MDARRLRPESTLHKTLIRTVVVGPHIYTVHTGDRTPAVYLAETEEHWHMRGRSGKYGNSSLPAYRIHYLFRDRTM
jgi:hypothetical protein